MRPIRAVVLGAVFAAGAAIGRGQASGADAWDRLATANNLDTKGKLPFRMEIAFQLYGMDGKATRSGTVAHWWSAPGLERVVVHLDGLNEDGSLLAGASHELVRDRYLVSQLLNFSVHPVPLMPERKDSIQDENKIFGKLHLDCLGPEARNPSGQVKQSESVCTQPRSDLVLARMAYMETQIMTRESTGKFHSTDVALKLRLRCLGREVIAGDVTRLQDFDAAKSEVALRTFTAEDETMPNGPIYTDTANLVVRTKRTTFVEPRLPKEDREAKAILDVIVGKDGSVADVVPIACSDAAFCAIATQAFSQHRYAPALLNGRAMVVSMTDAVVVQRN